MWNGHLICNLGNIMQVIVRGHAAAGYHNDILQAMGRKLEPAGFQVHPRWLCVCRGSK